MPHNQEQDGQFKFSYSYNILLQQSAATKQTTDKMLNVIDLTSTSSTVTLIADKDKEIVGRSWGDSANSKAVALLVHGLGAHSGWCEAFARELQARGIFCLSYDHAGFGNRREVPFSSYKQWLADLRSVFQHVQKTYPDKPIYLIGNSMGSLLSMVCAQSVSPAGLVLLSPGFDGCAETFTMAYRVLTVIKALLAPEMEIALPYGIDLCSRSETVIDWVNSDADGRFLVPGKMLLQLLLLSNDTKHKAMHIDMPVLMMTAGRDKIVDNAINKALYEKLSAPTKTSYCFGESFHDLMFDPIVDEVAQQVVDWMDKQ